MQFIPPLCRSGGILACFVKEALERYIEDKADYILAAQSMKKTQTTFSLEEVLQEFRNEL
jgi:predicted DNA-binding protein